MSSRSPSSWRAPEILPICACCRKIRDDENDWHTVECDIARQSDSQFSHGICPECLDTVLWPQSNG